MEDTNQLIEQRKAKLAALRARGLDPFKNKFVPSEKCADARHNYTEGRAVSLGGRITAHRDMGKSQFLDLKDQSGRIQIYAQKNVLGDEQYDIFKHLDLGDFIGVKGTLFTTKAGEISVRVESFVILAKALRPPPAKWHGLEDTEIRYRQRYLDLMANDEVRQTFLKRSAIVHEIRQFFHDRGYVEVETPAMQAIPGGAAAQPFKTFHKALGCDFYLRIALELYHKRLLVGGIDRLFEIGKIFRNEGLSRKHNPEFTMLEAYCAFGDYESMMETVQSLICQVAQKVLGTLRIEHDRRGDVNALISSSMASISLARSVLLGHPANETIRKERTERLEKIWRPHLLELEKCHAALGSESSVALAKRAQVIFGEASNSFLQDKLSGNSPLDWEYADPLIWPDFAHQSTKFAPLTEPKIIELTPPWRRVKYKDLIREKVKDDWFQLTPEEKLIHAEQSLGIDIAGRPARKLVRTIPDVERQLKEKTAVKDWPALLELYREILKRGEYVVEGVEDFEATAAVFEKLIEPTLIQPTFVTHLPKELVPLAKLSPDDPSTVEVFECCINGQEIAPGYTEQNDPEAQRNALMDQAGGEQQKLDEDFLVALEHGMPPAGGIGIGIDRLCMMLLGQESIRDVILFPQLKPR